MIQPFDPKIAHLRWPFRFHIHQGGTNLLKKATTMQLGDEISRDWVLRLEVRWMNFIHFQKIGHEWLWIVDNSNACTYVAVSSTFMHHEKLAHRHCKQQRQQQQEQKQQPPPRARPLPRPRPQQPQQRQPQPTHKTAPVFFSCNLPGRWLSQSYDSDISLVHDKRYPDPLSQRIHRTIRCHRSPQPREKHQRWIRSCVYQSSQSVEPPDENKDLKNWHSIFLGCMTSQHLDLS